MADQQSWKNVKVMVAGGCGYVGGHLVQRLVKAGAQVRVADDLSRGSESVLEPVKDQVEFLKLDLRIPEAAERACQGMHTVFNLAANASGIRYSISNQAQMFHDNAAVTLNVLEAARLAEVKRYVYFSSSCVYPDGSPVPTSEEHGTRDAPESGNLGYGWAKRIGELQGQLYRKFAEMSVTSMRPVNILGEGEHYNLETGHVIPSLIIKANRAEGALEVMGSGKQTRAFIYVGDLCDIAMRIALEGHHIDEINACSPEEVTIGEIAHMVVDAVGRKDLTVQFDPSQPEGPRRKAADVTKLMEFLGEYQFTDIREGIQRMADEYKDMLAAGTAD
jgi:nucleoside-diphosphate-sugar epimerase